MKEFDCQQTSPEWFELRRGIPTASEMSRVITPAKWEPSAQAEDYLNELVAEVARLDPPVLSERGNAAMLHGKESEAEARAWYVVERGYRPEQVRQVGFCLTDCGRYGCSPDGLIEGDAEGPGGLELKAPFEPKHQVARLRKAVLPLEHKIQVHGCLLVTGRAFWDYLSYCRGFPPLLIRVYPDKFTEKLAVYLDDFCRRKDEVLNWLRTA